MRLVFAVSFLVVLILKWKIDVEVGKVDICEEGSVEMGENGAGRACMEQMKSMQMRKRDDGRRSFVVLGVARPAGETKGLQLRTGGEELQKLDGLCVIVKRGLANVKRRDAKRGYKGRQRQVADQDLHREFMNLILRAFAERIALLGVGVDIIVHIAICGFLDVDVETPHWVVDTRIAETGETKGFVAHTGDGQGPPAPDIGQKRGEDGKKHVGLVEMEFDVEGKRGGPGGPHLGLYARMGDGPTFVVEEEVLPGAWEGEDDDAPVTTDADEHDRCEWVLATGCAMHEYLHEELGGQDVHGGQDGEGTGGYKRDGRESGLREKQHLSMAGLWLHRGGIEVEGSVVILYLSLLSCESQSAETAI